MQTASLWRKNSTSKPFFNFHLDCTEFVHLHISLDFFFLFILIFDYELSPRESTAPVTFWISPECSEASYLTPIKPLLKAIMATIKQPCIKKNIFHNIIVPTRLYNSCRSQVVVRAPASTKQVDKILATLLDILSLAIYQNLSKKD